MVKLKRVYEHLQKLSDPCVDAALAAALPTADDAVLGPMSLILLQRKQTQGLVALIEQYHRLPEQVQRTVLGHVPELTRALRLAMDNQRSAGPSNAVHIIRRSGEVRLAYLVADQLRHGQDGLKDESAKCLLEMAQRTSCEAWDGTGPAHACDPEGAGFVASAVREALKFFAQHKRKDVLLAMFALPLPVVTELLGSLEDLGTEWTQPTCVLLTRSDTPGVRRAMIAALAEPALASFAVDGMGLALDTDQFDQVLTHWHLLLMRRYRLGQKRIKHVERYVPGPQRLLKAEAGPARGAATWLAGLPMDPATLIRHLGALSEAQDAGVRLGALRKLIGLTGEGVSKQQVNEAVAKFCTDKRPELVRIAVSHLTRVKYADITKVLAQLINSPNEQVRRLAGLRLSPVAFPRLWESWPRLNTTQRLAAGRALIKIDPQFHAALQDKMASADAQAKVRALSIVTELNQGLLVQDALVRLSRDSDVRVVASAIRALGTADPDRALPIIERALQHEDDRVRANAVEAISQIDAARYADELAAMVHEQEANRARANAIQALMQMRAEDAMRALHRMLSDTRPEHRASALWLVETMGVAEVARDVAEMSITEPDVKVRKKAGEVIHHIIEQMSQPVALDELMQDVVTSGTGQAEATA